MPSTVSPVLCAASLPSCSRKSSSASPSPSHHLLLHPCLHSRRGFRVCLLPHNRRHDACFRCAASGFNKANFAHRTFSILAINALVYEAQYYCIVSLYINIIELFISSLSSSFNRMFNLSIGLSILPFSFYPLPYYLRHPFFDTPTFPLYRSTTFPRPTFSFLLHCSSNRSASIDPLL